ncbi:hypothetical protein ABZ707_12725 [Streptomyces sp. NPDC006923]|uniref:hypothetical protein n=1 Tax=Streptomyces sp. NPDC006923 TaxID=3155355 RepID=UPI0033F134D9
MRTYLSTALIVLLAVLTPLSAIAAWADLEIGDTDRFVSTMAPLASDPAVRNAVAERITDGVMPRIHVGQLQDEVRALLLEAVRSFATTDAFKSAWMTASRAAHDAGEQVLTSGGGNTVTIDLAPVAERVKMQLVTDRVPFANRIPVRHDDITVLRANGLGVWRDVVQGLVEAGVRPAVGTVVLMVSAVLLAVRRRRALIGVGLSLAVGAVVLAVAVAMARGTILGNLPNDSDRSAARAIYDVLTGSLRTTSWSVLAAGLALAAGAWFGRRPRHPPPAPPARAREPAESRLPGVS